MRSGLNRAKNLVQRIGRTVPIWLAPMADACSVSPAAAAAIGALLTEPVGIGIGTSEFSAQITGPVQINLRRSYAELRPTGCRAPEQGRRPDVQREPRRVANARPRSRGPRLGSFETRACSIRSARP